MSSDGQREKIRHNFKGRPSTSVSFLADKDERINANNFVVTKNPSIQVLSILSWTEVGSNLNQPQKTIKVASEILKMNPTLRYFLSRTLELASNQLHTSSSKWHQGSHKGTLTEFLSTIILTQRLSHGDQSLPQYFYNCSVQAHYNSSPSLKLERFSTFLTKVEYPSFGRIRDDCNFRSTDSLASAFKFLQTARMTCDFPLAVVFATSTSGCFVKLKTNKI